MVVTEICIGYKVYIFVTTISGATEKSLLSVRIVLTPPGIRGSFLIPVKTNLFYMKCLCKNRAWAIKVRDKERNDKRRAVYYELFGNNNLPGHAIHIPKFDPVLYNKRRNTKFKRYRIQFCMRNPVNIQDTKVPFLHDHYSYSSYRLWL